MEGGAQPILPVCLHPSMLFGKTSQKDVRPSVEAGVRALGPAIKEALLDRLCPGSSQDTQLGETEA